VGQRLVQEGTYGLGERPNNEIALEQYHFGTEMARGMGRYGVRHTTRGQMSLLRELWGKPMGMLKGQGV